MSDQPSSEPDIFAEVFALLTPERLLQHPRATGAGVSVCVIDSGIERAVLVLPIVAIAGGAVVAFASRSIAHDMGRAANRPTGNWPAVA